MTDLRGRRTYGDYLALERILTAQSPVSNSHDEMLFIIIHQATELWMKLAIHELRAACTLLATDQPKPCFKMLARVSRIQSQLIQSWDVLSTLTPAEYLAFRDKLGPASGFQSHQYRLVEFILGHKNRARLAPFRHQSDTHEELTGQLEQPGLYDQAIRLLSHRGFSIDRAQCERDWSQPYRTNESVRRAWAAIYADTQEHWELYELAEKLVDLEDWFQQWRFRHLTTVERIIGMKHGTGGTEGVSYLKRALDVRFFPELWELRTQL